MTGTLAPETDRPCRTCKAVTGQPCRASDGTPGTHIHSARRQAHQDADPARAYHQGSLAMLDWAKHKKPADWRIAVEQRNASVDLTHPYNRGALDTLRELIEETEHLVEGCPEGSQCSLCAAHAEMSR